MSCDSTVDVDMGDVELPDVLTPTKKNKHEFKTDSIVWAKWRKEFWPALVRRCNITKKKKKVVIVFVDRPCDDKGNESRLSIDVKNIVRFDSSPRSVELMRDGLNGSDELRQSIETAKRYIVKRGMNGIAGSPVQFLADPLLGSPKAKVSSAKRKILEDDNEDNVKKLAVETPSKAESDVKKEEKETSNGEKKDDLNITPPAERKRDERLSERILTTVKTDACMNHLLRILKGKLKSKRHDSFQNTTKRSKIKGNVICFDPILSEAQLHEVVDFYKPIVEKETSKSKSYVINYTCDVMAPEALAFALKSLLKLSNKDIENILQLGQLPESFQAKVDALV